MLPKMCAGIIVITFTNIYEILPMHSNATIKNVSGLTLAGPTCKYLTVRKLTVKTIE